MLTNKTESDNYLIQLDGIRAIAVLMVMFSHFAPFDFFGHIPFGSMGVNIFFVLSGFLITRILLRAKEKAQQNSKTFYGIGQFYLRRTLRIFPIYYLTITFLYILNYEPTRNISPWLYSYLMNIKFAMPGIWKTPFFGYFIHFWSLCVEEQFYLFFPFLVFLIPKKNLKIAFISLVIIAVLTRLVLYVTHAPQNSLYVLTPCCLDAFGTGALLAYFYLYEREKLKAILNYRMFFAISAILFILDIIISQNFIKDYGECRTVLERFIFCISCFYLIGIGSLREIKGRSKRVIENKYMLFTGKISYGLYIYHNFIPDLNQYLTHKFPNYVYQGLNNHSTSVMVICFSFTYIVAILSWYIIELPINNLKNRLSH